MSGKNGSAVGVDDQHADGAASLEVGARLVRASGVAAELAKAEREQGELTRLACLDALNQALRVAQDPVSGEEAQGLKALGETLCAVTLDFETQQR